MLDIMSLPLHEIKTREECRRLKAAWNNIPREKKFDYQFGDYEFYPRFYSSKDKVLVLGKSLDEAVGFLEALSFKDVNEFYRHWDNDTFSAFNLSNCEGFREVKNGPIVEIFFESFLQAGSLNKPGNFFDQKPRQDDLNRAFPELSAVLQQPTYSLPDPDISMALIAKAKELECELLVAPVNDDSSKRPILKALENHGFRYSAALEEGKMITGLYVYHKKRLS